MFYSIKRWFMFRFQPEPKIGQIRTFYPFDKKDTLKQDVELVGIEKNGWIIHYKIVGQEVVLKIPTEDFFELYIDKAFYDRWN